MGSVSKTKNKMPLLCLFAFVFAGLVVGIDQWIKWIIVENVNPIERISVIPHIFSLFYLENRGAAFSIFENKQLFLILFTSLLCVVIIGMILFYKSQNAWSWVACILVLGGGIGNLIDRIRLGYVVDYLKFSFFPPVFNVADICVVTGVILFIIHVLLGEYAHK